MGSSVVALGDSFSCGEGVGIEIRAEQTWVALLCSALPGAQLVNLSTPGARVRDVRRNQLPQAVAARPQLATIMVGLNDVIRSGLCAEQLGLDMGALIEELCESGATVLIARWHDPAAVLGIRGGLRRALAGRLALVNNAIDEAATTAHALVLDLGRVPELADPGAWAVDGIHPSPAGHRAIASSAIRLLADSGVLGLQLPDVAELVSLPPSPGRARRVHWLISRGLPWMAQHSARVAPAVLSMVAEALREQGSPRESRGYCSRADL